MVFVWTLNDILGLSLIVIAVLASLAIIGYYKAKRAWLRWRKR